MGRIGCLVVLFLAGCGPDSDARVGDVALGMTVDELRATYPDLRPVTRTEDIPQAEKTLGELSDALVFERGPAGGLKRQYFRFVDGTLLAYSAAYDDSVDPAELRARVGGDRLPSAKASAMGSSVTAWEGSGYTLGILSFAGTKEGRMTLVFLKGEAESTVLRAIILGLLGLGLINLISIKPVLSAFNQNIKRIETEAHLNELKRVASRSMYGALLQIVLLAVPNAIWAWAWGDERLGSQSAMLIIGANAVVILTALWLKGEEKQVMGCQVSPELAAAKEEIVRAWKSTALPRW